MKLEFTISESRISKESAPCELFKVQSINKIQALIREYENMDRQVRVMGGISDHSRAEFWSKHFDFVEDMRTLVFRAPVDRPVRKS